MDNQKCKVAVPEDPRIDMVDTAVKFLENPKVAHSSEEIKRKFLTKKGLTESEIDLAFQKARPPPPPVQASFPIHEYPPQMALVPQYTGWQRFRDIANMIFLLVGAGYGLKYLWQKYIKEWLYEETKPKISPQEELLNSQRELLSLMKSLNESVQKLSDWTRDQIGSKSSDEATVTRDILTELKRDVQSVKGLMLSPSRFPANPQVEPPKIPQWQLEDKIHSNGPLKEPDLVQDQSSDGQDGIPVQHQNGA